ncbi:MAG: hypothetical protein L6R41_001288 [Letrouitia leprolyta]|nr:MAG: hypothetical protein L6R41_001288 [Letrouitia leprolyta]
MIIAALFLALSVITTSVRVAVRSVKHQLGWDDYAISLATILALVEIVFNGLEVKEGAGRHAFYLSTGQQQRSLKATGSAAARASLSGNNKDPDLTWNLALISIWGALEENFGIIGANLALSRVLYVYWRGDKSLPRGERRYPQQSDFTGRGFRPTAGWRRNLYSSARSQDSVIPLEDTTIKKTTDLYVIREPRDESNMSGANAGLGGRTFVVEDRI